MTDSNNYKYVRQVCQNELDVLSLMAAFFDHTDENMLPDAEALTAEQRREVGEKVREIYYRAIVNASPAEGYAFFYAVVARLAHLFPVQYAIKGQNCRQEILAEQIKLTGCLEDTGLLKEEYKELFEFGERLQKGYDGQET